MISTADSAQHWAAVVEIIAGTCAIIAAAAAGARWWDKKQAVKLDEKFDEKLAPIVTELRQVNQAVNHVGIGEPRLIDQIRDQGRRLDAGEERFDRLERGQDQTHDMIAGLTNAQSQTTAALARLIEQHANPDDD